jgi:hypothetical protein
VIVTEDDAEEDDDCDDDDVGSTLIDEVDECLIPHTFMWKPSTAVRATSLPIALENKDFQQK